MTKLQELLRSGNIEEIQQRYLAASEMAANKVREKHHGQKMNIYRKMFTHLSDKEIEEKIMGE